MSEAYTLPPALVDARDAQIQGVIIGPVSYQYGSATLILENSRVQTASGMFTLEHKLRVQIYDVPLDSIALQDGDTVSVLTNLRALRPRRNPGGYDERTALWARGICATASASLEDLARIDVPRAGGLLHAVAPLRQALTDSIETGFYQPYSGIIQAMLLGDREDMPEYIQQDFRTTGVAHVLAVSGLHVGILTGALVWVLRRLKLNARLRLAIVAVFLLLYCAVTQFPASICRASVMAFLVLLASATGRRYDMPTGIAAAFIIILLFNPFDLYTPGFQLSFAAVFGIACLYKPLCNLLEKAPDRLAQAISVSLAAQLGVLPLLAYHFNTVSPVSLLANLILIPVFSVLITLAFAAMLLGAVWHVLALPFSLISTQMLRLALYVNTRLAEIPYASISVAAPSLIWIIGWFAGMVTVSPFTMGMRRVKAASTTVLAGGVTAALILVRVLSPSALTITVLDVGQGDALHIQTPGGRHILVDAGPAILGYDAGEFIVAPYLLDQGVVSLDAMILTHADADHSGGAHAVLSAIDTKVVYAPNEETLQAAQTEGTLLSRGDRLELEPGIVLDVLYPVENMGQTANETSCVLLLKAEGFTMLLCADADGEAERYYARSAGDVDVLKVAHHGSANAAGVEFLRHARPEYAIISVGPNAYGHPDEDGTARLAGMGSRVLRTDMYGAVQVRVAQGEYTVNTQWE